MHLAAPLFSILATCAASVSQITTSKDLRDLQGTWIIQCNAPGTAHSNLFAPIWKEAVAEAEKEQLGLNFAEINCLDTPNLCTSSPQELPSLKVWSNGFQSELRPSSHSSHVLYRYFQSVVNPAPLPAVDEESAEEGKAPPMSLQYSPYTQQDGVPIPVYPREFTPVHAEGKSVLLNPENFEETIVESGQPWMIKFYSPRCPYSRAMADEWERYANTGLFNIAEFDCLQDVNYCLSSGVQFYPTIMFVDGVYRREYVSTLEIPQWESFHQMQSGAQIVPAKDYDDLKTLVDAAASRGVGSFVYLHDESTVSEDWEAAVNQSRVFTNARSVLLRSSDADVRRELGVNFLGSALVMAGKTVDDQDNDVPFYYTFDNTHQPLKMRDPVEVEKWVQQVRFSQPIRLSYGELENINNYADVHAVLISTNTRHEKFKKLRRHARNAYDIALELQRADQKKLRDTRKQMHLELKEQGKKSTYRKVYLTPVQAPLLPELSFSYIPKDEWDSQFGDILDTSGHEEGDVIFLNLARGLYIDSNQGEKLEDFSFAALYDQANFKPFKQNLGLKPVVRPEVKFVPNLDFGDRIVVASKYKWVALAVVIAVAGAFGARLFVYLRHMTMRQRRGYKKDY